MSEKPQLFPLLEAQDSQDCASKYASLQLSGTATLLFKYIVPMYNPIKPDNTAIMINISIR
ncbi:MAG: hypothetical protein KKH92_02230 [Firmicutes bacterium]|nr:hypothetical protein [Bacillota bacterium]